MRGVLILISISLLCIPLVNAVNAQNIGAPGVPFDQTSDNNANVSFLPGDGTMNFSADNMTAGSEKALNNTIGNSTESMKPGFDPSKPIDEYDTNSSDWNKIHPFAQGRSD
jgi:hypothetical protein